MAMTKNIRFSDLYRNVARYLKRHDCGHDFTGTRQWLARWTEDQAMIDEAIKWIRDSGAGCDYEVMSLVKPRVNGGTILVVIDVL